MSHNTIKKLCWGYDIPIPPNITLNDANYIHHKLYRRYKYWHGDIPNNPEIHWTLVQLYHVRGDTRFKRKCNKLINDDVFSDDNKIKAHTILMNHDKLTPNQQFDHAIKALKLGCWDVIGMISSSVNRSRLCKVKLNKYCVIKKKTRDELMCLASQVNVVRSLIFWDTKRIPRELLHIINVYCDDEFGEK